MGISLDHARKHISVQSERLRRFPKNRNWPKYLFHAAQVEVAVQILRSETVIPRANQERLIHDVANPGAVSNKQEAQSYSRLYFRPKNDFHFRTEGIKYIGDPYRLNKQMSVPIMLAFDSESILASGSTSFTNGNFARLDAVQDNTENFFDSIPFKDVYHDSPPPRARMEEVHTRRMAEVVYYGPMPIRPYLRTIICRTPMDRDTLLYLLGESSGYTKNPLTVEQIFGSTFMHKGMYMKDIGFHGGFVKFQISQPHKLPQSGQYTVLIQREINGEIVESRGGHVTSTATKIKVGPFDFSDDSTWSVYLEEVIAYRGKVASSGSALF